MNHSFGVCSFDAVGAHFLALVYRSLFWFVLQRLYLWNVQFLQIKICLLSFVKQGLTASRGFDWFSTVEAITASDIALAK